MNRLDAAISELTAVVLEIADFTKRTFQAPKIDDDGNLNWVPTWESVSTYPEHEALRKRLNLALGAVLGLGDPVWQGGDLRDRLEAIRNAVLELPGWGVANGWGGGRDTRWAEAARLLAREKRDAGGCVTTGDIRWLLEQRAEKLTATVALLSPLRINGAAPDLAAGPAGKPQGVAGGGGDDGQDTAGSGRRAQNPVPASAAAVSSGGVAENKDDFPELQVDFFVSYTCADQHWAEWIAWHLEQAGYRTLIQAWDFRPGANFVQRMQDAAGKAHRTVAVLSPDYLQSQFTKPEWYAAFAQDPTGEKGTLLPVRIAECELTGLLPQIVYIDLVGLDQDEAKHRLLAGVNRSRAKPTRAPSFPDTQPSAPSFPGT